MTTNNNQDPDLFIKVMTPRGCHEFTINGKGILTVVYSSLPNDTDNVFYFRKSFPLREFQWYATDPPANCLLSLLATLAAERDLRVKAPPSCFRLCYGHETKNHLTCTIVAPNKTKHAYRLTMRPHPATIQQQQQQQAAAMLMPHHSNMTKKQRKTMRKIESTAWELMEKRRFTEAGLAFLELLTHYRNDENHDFIQGIRLVLENISPVVASYYEQEQHKYTDLQGKSHVLLTTRQHMTDGNTEMAIDTVLKGLGSLNPEVNSELVQLLRILLAREAEQQSPQPRGRFPARNQVYVEELEEIARKYTKLVAKYKEDNSAADQGQDRDEEDKVCLSQARMYMKQGQWMLAEETILNTLAHTVDKVEFIELLRQISEELMHAKQQTDARYHELQNREQTQEDKIVSLEEIIEELKATSKYREATKVSQHSIHIINTGAFMQGLNLLTQGLVDLYPDLEPIQKALNYCGECMLQKRNKFLKSAHEDEKTYMERLQHTCDQYEELCEDLDRREQEKQACLQGFQQAAEAGNWVSAQSFLQQAFLVACGTQHKDLIDLLKVTYNDVQVSAAKEEIQQLKTQLEQSDAKRKQMQTEHDAQVKEAQTRNQDLEDQVKEAHTRNQDLEDQVKEAQTRNQDLEDQVKEAQTRDQDLEDQVKEAQTRNQDLKDQLKETQALSEQLKEKNAQVAEENARLVDMNDKLKQDVLNINQQHEQSKDEVAFLRKQIDNLQQQLNKKEKGKGGESESANASILESLQHDVNDIVQEVVQQEQEPTQHDAKEQQQQQQQQQQQHAKDNQAIQLQQQQQVREAKKKKQQALLKENEALRQQLEAMQRIQQEVKVPQPQPQPQQQQQQQQSIKTKPTSVDFAAAGLDLSSVSGFSSSGFLSSRLVDVLDRTLSFNMSTSSSAPTCPEEEIQLLARIVASSVPFIVDTLFRHASLSHVVAAIQQVFQSHLNMKPTYASVFWIKALLVNECPMTESHHLTSLFADNCLPVPVFQHVPLLRAEPISMLRSVALQFAVLKDSAVLLSIGTDSMAGKGKSTFLNRLYAPQSGEPFFQTNKGTPVLYTVDLCLDWTCVGFHTLDMHGYTSSATTFVQGILGAHVANCYLIHMDPATDLNVDDGTINHESGAGTAAYIINNKPSQCVVLFHVFAQQQQDVIDKFRSRYAVLRCYSTRETETVVEDVASGIKNIASSATHDKKKHSATEQRSDNANNDDDEEDEEDELLLVEKMDVMTAKLKKDIPELRTYTNRFDPAFAHIPERVSSRDDTDLLAEFFPRTHATIRSDAAVHAVVDLFRRVVDANDDLAMSTFAEEIKEWKRSICASLLAKTREVRAMLKKQKEHLATRTDDKAKKKDLQRVKEIQKRLDKYNDKLVERDVCLFRFWKELCQAKVYVSLYREWFFKGHPVHLMDARCVHMHECTTPQVFDSSREIVLTVSCINASGGSSMLLNKVGHCHFDPASSLKGMDICFSRINQNPETNAILLDMPGLLQASFVGDQDMDVMMATLSMIVCDVVVVSIDDGVEDTPWPALLRLFAQVFRRVSWMKEHSSLGVTRPTLLFISGDSHSNSKKSIKQMLDQAVQQSETAFKLSQLVQTITHCYLPQSRVSVDVAGPCITNGRCALLRANPKFGAGVLELRRMVVQHVDTAKSQPLTKWFDKLRLHWTSILEQQ